MLMGLGGEVWGERATGKKKRVQYTHIKMASNSQGRVPGTKQADPSLGPDTQMAFWNPGFCVQSVVMWPLKTAPTPMVIHDRGRGNR